MKVEYIESLCNCPVFLVGDFNAPKSERWHRILTIPNGNDLLDAKSEDIAQNLTQSRLHFVDTWDASSTKSCGACGQSTYHAWRGSYVSNHLWLPADSKPQHDEIALSGERHVDAVFVASKSRADVVVLKAKMLTDDKRIRYLGGPFASDHYPVFASVRLLKRGSNGSGSDNGLNGSRYDEFTEKHHKEL